MELLFEFGLVGGDVVGEGGEYCGGRLGGG